MRKRRIFSWRVEYAFVRAVEAILGIFPRGLALALGRGLGSLARALGVRRSTVRANLDYLGFDPEAARRIVPALYRNMGMYFVDVLRTPNHPPPHRIHGKEILEDAGTRGAVVLLAHFGNFELLASVFGSMVKDVNVIVRPMHNPYVESWLRRRRLATGVETLPAQENAVRKGFAVLKRKGILAALVDQSPGSSGAPVPFMGKPAATVRAIAGLQERADAVLVSAYAVLGPDRIYDVVLELHPACPREDVLAIQSFHNEVIAAWVRERPEHWFGWFHRRFRPYVDYSR